MNFVSAYKTDFRKFYLFHKHAKGFQPSPYSNFIVRVNCSAFSQQSCSAQSFNPPTGDQLLLEQLELDEVLGSISLDLMSQTVLTTTQTNLLSSSIARSSELLFKDWKPVKTGPYRDSEYQFLTLINWVYSNQIGYCVENSLRQNLLNESAKSKFQNAEHFLNFQKTLSFAFEGQRPITLWSSQMELVLFNKSSLVRIIRLLLLTYNKDFYDALNAQERFVLIKELVTLSRSQGSYSLINCLFEKLTMLSVAKVGLASGLRTKMVQLGKTSIFLSTTSVMSTNVSSALGVQRVKKPLMMQVLYVSSTVFGLVCFILSGNSLASNVCKKKMHTTPVVTSRLVIQKVPKQLPFAAFSMSSFLRGVGSSALNSTQNTVTGGTSRSILNTTCLLHDKNVERVIVTVLTSTKEVLKQLEGLRAAKVPTADQSVETVIFALAPLQSIPNLDVKKLRNLYYYMGRRMEN